MHNSRFCLIKSGYDAYENTCPRIINMVYCCYQNKKLGQGLCGDKF